MSSRQFDCEEEAERVVLDAARSYTTHLQENSPLNTPIDSIVADSLHVEFLMLLEDDADDAIGRAFANHPVDDAQKLHIEDDEFQTAKTLGDLKEIIAERMRAITALL